MMSLSRVDPVADGVFRLSTARVNCYLIADDEGIVLVDGGLPQTWPKLMTALGTLGATPSDIDAVVLTHGHPDHVGMCDRLGWEHGVDSYVHPADRQRARNPYRPAPDTARAPSVPRRSAALPTLGHTGGHCAYLLEKRGILFTGDALVTYDPYTAGRGPRVVPDGPKGNDAALEAVDVLESTGARLVLPGHGEPFAEGIAAAAVHARAAGAQRAEGRPMSRVLLSRISERMVRA